MAVSFPRLGELHANMAVQGLTRTKIPFRFRTLLFSVIYLAEEFPHELLFGCLNHSLFFTAEVHRGYVVTPFLGDVYGKLVRALGLRPDPANPFSPAVLFEELARVVPTTTSPANSPTMAEVIKSGPDVEEADKIYFCGWLTHDGRNSRPTTDNLKKTQRTCGLKIHESCCRHHISSRWTNDPAKAIKYHAPPGI